MITEKTSNKVFLMLAAIEQDSNSRPILHIDACFMTFCPDLKEPLSFQSSLFPTLGILYEVRGDQGDESIERNAQEEVGGERGNSGLRQIKSSHQNYVGGELVIQ